MQRNQRRFIGVLAISLLLFTSAVSVGSAEEKPAGTDAVAKVNGVVITKANLDKELAIILPQLAQMGRPAPTAEELKGMKMSVLEELIDGELLYQKSVKEGITVDDTLVGNKLFAIKGQFSTPEEYDKTLTLLDTTEEELKSQIRRSLTIQKLVAQEVESKIKVDDEVAKSFYDANTDKFKQPEQVKASHILVVVKPDADQAAKDEALNKIKSIQDKIKKGEDFADLAKKNSEGPSSVNGGDLGYFVKGQMVKPFEEAAFSLNPGEVSDVVETQFGYHLIKVYDKKSEKTVSYDEVKPKLIEFLKQQEMERELSAYLENLKKDADISLLMSQEE